MKLYGWVQSLIRFADNVHEALPAILKLLDAAEMLMVRVIIFTGFSYGVYAFIHIRAH